MVSSTLRAAVLDENGLAPSLPCAEQAQISPHEIIVGLQSSQQLRRACSGTTRMNLD
jgi:hypothetical protein